MISWFKTLFAPKPASRQDETPRFASPENCALWHDVSRALDAKPKGAGK